jgi:hypothetical protein
MPDVRYVCLSDLHFGAENSILTCLAPGGVVPDPDRPSTAMVALVDGLADLIGKNEDTHKPTLILCGDILELALSTDNVAAMVFERFVERVFPENGRLFADTIYFVPGNHDHHLWEAARERQYAHYARRRPLSQELEPPWHTTRMFTEADPHPVDAELLTTLVRRYPTLHDVCVRTIYPNLGLRSKDGSRCVVIHHGHYVEAMYRLMTTLKDIVFPGRPTPQQVWEWEAENFAWIDFFWSTLGRSGDVGADVGLVYASLQSDDAMARVASNLATGLAERMQGPRPLKWAEAKALQLLLSRVVRRVGRLERNHPATALSDKARAGLALYLEGPLLGQLHAELHGADVPHQLTFVFGHTHKPFELSLAAQGYPGPVAVYNTGGWVVDSLKPAPRQGGAVILIDEDLNTVSLRAYNQSADPSSYRVSLNQVGSDPNPFHRRLQGLVDPERQPWSGLSEAAAALVPERNQDLARLLKQGLGTPPAAAPAGRTRSSPR